MESGQGRLGGCGGGGMAVVAEPDDPRLIDLVTWKKEVILLFDIV